MMIVILMIFTNFLNPGAVASSPNRGNDNPSVPGVYLFMENEIWKDVKGYEGRYVINSISEIKSIRTGKILTPTKKRDGYYQTKLYASAIPKMFYNHRMAAISFLPNSDKKPFVNHKDGNKKNNSINNLEWCTASENAQHSFDNNLQVSLKNGEHPGAKICLNILTGIYYDCIKEAMATTNYKHYCFHSQLCGKVKNRTNFILV